MPTHNDNHSQTISLGANMTLPLHKQFQLQQTKEILSKASREQLEAFALEMAHQALASQEIAKQLMLEKLGALDA